MSAWNETEISHLYKLFSEGNTPNRIAEVFHTLHTTSAIDFEYPRTLEAIRRKLDRLENTPTYKYLTRYKALETHTELLNKQCEEFRLREEPIILGASDIHRKILCLSDLHVPFTLWDEVNAAIQANQDAEILVLNGDLLDNYSGSTFTKNQRIPLLLEYNIFMSFLQKVATIFKTIVLVSGNHEARSTRVLSDLEIEQQSIFDGNLIHRLANGEILDQHGRLERKIDWQKEYGCRMVFDRLSSWYMQVGKTIFAHPSGYGGKGAGATVYKVLELLREVLPSNSFDSVVIGHVHGYYKGVIDGCLLIEQGCLANRMGYESKADLRFRPGQRGYSIVYQDAEGKTHYNMSGPIYLGYGVEPKKAVTL